MSQSPVSITNYSVHELRKLGKLRNEAAEQRPNPHVENTILTYINLEFEGLEIFGVVIDKDSDELTPIKITITTSAWKILHDLNVGTPALRIQEFLGKPSEEGESFQKYCGETDCVRFSIDRGRIATIELSYYVD